MATVPGPLFGYAVQGSAHEQTRSISAEHKVVLFSHHTTLEELVGGMLTLHTIPLDLANIAYGEEASL